MSVEAMAWVWRHARVDGTELLLLLAIADSANGEGEGWPSVESLAAKARLSTRQTRRLIDRLVDAGEVELRRGVGRGRFSVYAVGKGVIEGSSPLEKVTSRAAGRAEKVTSGVAGRGKGDIQGAEKVTPGADAAGKGDSAGNGYKGGDPLELEVEGSLSVPVELAAFHAELSACPGYDPDERFFSKVLEKYGSLDLEEQAIRIRGWFGDKKASKGRACSRGFVLGWLRREVDGGGRRGGAAAVGRGGLERYG